MLALFLSLSAAPGRNKAPEKDKTSGTHYKHKDIKESQEIYRRP